MTVSIVGTGYVGLVTGACLAEKGEQVVCVDTDAARVQSIQDRQAPFFEKGLPALLERHVGRRLHATTNLRQAIADSDLTLIAVGTPFDGQAIDLTFVRQAARQVGEALRDKSSFHTVVVKSTVVPGTTEEVVLPALEASSGKTAGEFFGVGMNPEFLTEGCAVDDFLHPDRIVLGAHDGRARERLDQLYDSFAGIEKIRTNCRSAELIKYASNSLLATMISFANEMANLCTAVGDVDVVDVLQGVHKSHYLTHRAADGSRWTAPIASFLEAGCGFGGSCLPKDVNSLVRHAEILGQSMPLLRAVMQVNQEQPRRVLDQLCRAFTELRGLRVTILGLAFKPDTDDIRQSPAFPLIDLLLAAGARLTAYDPVAMPAAARHLRERPIRFAEDLSAAVTDADAVVLVTRWEEFRAVPELLARLPAPPLFVDGRRMLDKGAFRRYSGIGL